MTESEGKLLKALRPFADCVFNDNGDVTYTFSNARPEDYFRAYRLVRNADTRTPTQPTPSPVDELVEFFRGEGYSWFGFNGDSNGWTPEHCAVEALRDFIRWKLANPQAKIPTYPNVTEGIGRWLSAALDDPNVCDDMKADIQKWFAAGSPSPTSEAGREPVAWRYKHSSHRNWTYSDEKPEGPSVHLFEIEALYASDD